MSELSDARDFSIVMAYEALRICLYGETKTYAAEEVLRWMQLMLNESARA